MSNYGAPPTGGGPEDEPEQPAGYPGGQPPAYPRAEPMQPLGAMPLDQSPGTEKPPAPPSVMTAVKLMYAGAVLSLISLIVTLFSRGDIHDAVVKANNSRTGDSHLSASQIDTAVNLSFGIGIVLGLIGIGLWLLMARMNQGGRWWARIVATVLCVLCVLSTFSALTRSGSTIISTVLSIIMVIIAIGATVMLYRPDSSDFFSRCKALRDHR